MFTNIGGKFVYSHFVTGTGQNLDGRSVIAADFDRDGDQDLILRNLQKIPFQILRNQLPPGHHAIAVKLKGQSPNWDAIGAQVTLTCEGKLQRRQVAAGDSFLGQSPLELHFGLGTCSSMPQLKLRWPDGLVENIAVPLDALTYVERKKGIIKSIPLNPRRELLSSSERIRTQVLSDLKGQKKKIIHSDKAHTIVTLWAPWCDACKAEIPKLKDFTSKHPDSEIAFVVFEEDDVGLVKKTAKGLGISNKTLLGEQSFFNEILKNDEVEIPITIVFDKTGAPMRYFSGKLDEADYRTILLD